MKMIRFSIGVLSERESRMERLRLAKMPNVTAASRERNAFSSAGPLRAACGPCCVELVFYVFR